MPAANRLFLRLTVSTVELQVTVMREILDRFDDIILLAISESQLQELVDRLELVSRKYSLLINIDKTKVIGERRHIVSYTHLE